MTCMLGSVTGLTVLDWRWLLKVLLEWCREYQQHVGPMQVFQSGTCCWLLWQSPIIHINCTVMDKVKMWHLKHYACFTTKILDPEMAIMANNCLIKWADMLSEKLHQWLTLSLRFSSGWWRGTEARMLVLACELSLLHAPPSADGWPLNCPLKVSQPGQFSLSSSRGR